jgi:inhibitor of KinA
MNEYKFIQLSESALLIKFGDIISLPLHEQVMQAKDLIDKNRFIGFTETVPAYNSLAVYYNPLQVSKEEETISATLQKQPSNNPKNITIPVCYDKEFGIDLEELSLQLQLSTEEIIYIHKSKTYKVFMTGFTPGFPYMGIIDERLTTKRRSSPRVTADAGSVAIAGNQTGIYPLNTPGGWNIIGRTPLKIFDLNKENPFVLKAGDEIKFEAITKDEFENYAPSDLPAGRQAPLV